MSDDYAIFIDGKTHLAGDFGFDPIWLPSTLFDFQKSITEWAILKGRAAIFADCGLGKTAMQLVWAENVRRHAGRVLILTPLAVGVQTVAEGHKFDVECSRSIDGVPAPWITVANYEKLHLFDPSDFVGVVCDESSILKNYDGKRRGLITQFMRKMPYRLLCTATAAPNDYIELGTSAEALGAMGHMDMLGKFFRNTQGTVDTKKQWRAHGSSAPHWRFKRHAEQHFWRWVCSWARALRKPSDMGFSDAKFALPPLVENEILIETGKAFPGELFPRAAVSLAEQRQERRLNMSERCYAVADRVNASSESHVIWCHMNEEGDKLEKLIGGSVQVAGSNSDAIKEQRLQSFADGSVRNLITKPRIGGYGLNWQHCHNVSFFPSHSFEQYYQAVRRCWRFGQNSPVSVDIVTTQGEAGVLANLKRKALAADTMFDALVQHMNDPLLLQRGNPFATEMETPKWM